MFFGKLKELRKENEALKRELVFVKNQFQIREDMLVEARRKLDKYLPDPAPAAPEGRQTIFVRGYYKKVRSKE